MLRFSLVGSMVVFLALPFLHAQTNAFTPAWKQVSNWDATVSNWEEIFTSSYQYNSDGQVTEELTENTSGNDTRVRSTYSPSGKLLEQVTEIEIGGTWTNQYRSTLAYDGLDSLVERVDLDWQNNAWDTIGGLRHDYQYNNGQLENDFISTWDPSGWVLSRWFGYQYSAIGEWDTVQIFTRISNQWQPAARLVDIQWEDFSLAKFLSFKTDIYLNGNFMDDNRRAYAYSGAKDVTIYEESWNSGWDSNFVYVTRYDLQGNLILEEDYDFPAGTKERTVSRVFTHTYDIAGLLLRSIETQSYQAAPYVNVQETVYPGFMVNFNSPALSKLEATFFPNPSSGSFSLRMEASLPATLGYQVFDQLGKVVAEGKVRQNGSPTVYAELLHLPPGLFFYRLVNADQSVSGKLLVH